MSNCKWCDVKIFWTQERSVMGEVWRAYEDEECTKRHQCENYKPKSRGLKQIQAEAKAQKEREWSHSSDSCDGADESSSGGEFS